MSVATCQYEFLWITDLACPLNTKNSSVVGFKNCTAINPQTNVLFDLNPLKETSGKDYRVTDQNGHYYLLNVCTGLSSKEGVLCVAYCVKNARALRACQHTWSWPDYVKEENEQ